MSREAMEGRSDFAQDDRQKIAPAFFAFPPSMAVVCGGCMDAQEPRGTGLWVMIAPVMNDCYILIADIRVQHNEGSLSSQNRHTNIK